LCYPKPVFFWKAGFLLRGDLYSAMKRNVWEAIGILCFSILIAFFTNQIRSDGIPLIRPSTSPISANSEEHIVSLQELVEKMEKPGVLIVDARSSEDFREGHVPGATNVPYDEVFEDPSFFLDEIPPGREIITYCEGIGCSNAEDVALFLQERGHDNVKVFLGGWEEWKESGMPVAKESE